MRNLQEYLGECVGEFVRARTNELADEAAFIDAEYRELNEQSEEEWKKMRNLLGEQYGPLAHYEALVGMRQLIGMRLAYRQGMVDVFDALGIDPEDVLGGIASYIGMNRQATGTLETLSSQSGTSAA